MSDRLFRPAALEQLSQQEPTNELLQVVSLRSWAQTALQAMPFKDRSNSPLEVTSEKKQRRSPKRLRTRTVLQMEAAECGAAALGIVFAYFDVYVPLEQLREKCGVSRDGTNAARLLVVARQFGFRASAYRMEPDDLADLSLPAIIHWNFDHFVVLEGLDRDKVWINDPARGRRMVSRTEFERSFTGPVLSLIPGNEFKTRGSPPRALPVLMGWLRGYRPSVALIAWIGLLLVIPGLVVPALSRLFVDEVLAKKQTDLSSLLVTGLLATAFIRALLTWIHRNILSKLSFSLVKTLSSHYLNHAMKLPYAFYLARHPGDLASRVEISDRLSWLLSGDLPSVALSALMVFFYALLMLYMNAELTAVVMTCAALAIVIDRLGARSRGEKASQLTNEHAKWMGVSLSGLQSIETLKANGIESRFFDKWAALQSRVANLQQSMSLYSECLSAPTRYLHAIGTLTVLGLGASRVMSGELSVGKLVAFQSLMASFLGPLGELAGFAGQLDLIQAQIARYRDVLDHPTVGHASSEKSDSAAKDDSDAQDVLSGHIEFDQVSFGYNPLQPLCLNKLSFACEPGSRLAVVGRTGSGKSTVARLLSGLLQPSSGTILLDGQERRTIVSNRLTRSIATVEQEIHLFDGTIAENLTLWDDSVPLKAIERALHDSCMDQVIEKLPLALHTRVNEGGLNFSGGERQRLEIARALVRDPAILILDEATSALDTETEKTLYDRIQRRGCTTIIVAHRLSAVRDSDEIIVLEHGSVIERGRHDELWRNNGRYRQLIQTE